MIDLSTVLDFFAFAFVVSGFVAPAVAQIPLTVACRPTAPSLTVRMRLGPADRSPAIAREMIR